MDLFKKYPNWTLLYSITHSLIYDPHFVAELTSTVGPQAAVWHLLWSILNVKLEVYDTFKENYQVHIYKADIFFKCLNFSYNFETFTLDFHNVIMLLFHHCWYLWPVCKNNLKTIDYCNVKYCYFHYLSMKLLDVSE